MMVVYKGIPILSGMTYSLYLAENSRSHYNCIRYLLNTEISNTSTEIMQ